MKTIRIIALVLCVLCLSALAVKARASNVPNLTAATGPVGNISRVFILNDKLRIETPRGSVMCSYIDKGTDKTAKGRVLVVYVFAGCTEGYSHKPYGEAGSRITISTEIKSNLVFLNTKEMPELGLPGVALLGDPM
ncbi:hypothetical protein QF014_000408 [Pantoea agglomerans]|nr:hypothetical protein [Pantoea agglomerans]